MPKPKMQNEALRPLKDVLKYRYAKKDLEKLAFFVSDLPLKGVSDSFHTAVLISLDIKWWNEHADPAPITEIGVAAIRGEDITTFARDSDAKLEDLLSKIITWYIRPKETCHMAARRDWIQKGTEERFLFGTTSFPNQQEVSTFLSEVTGMYTVPQPLPVYSKAKGNQATCKYRPRNQPPRSSTRQVKYLVL
jgi:hypothetical protein